METKMKVVSIGKRKDTLSEVPRPPVYLTDDGKKHYKEMARILIKLERLKESYLSALEMYAEAMAQREFALREVKKKNKNSLGKGYIQTFKNGATNISTEVVLIRDAEKTLFKCFKQFGLDPLSEKDLKPADNNQLDLFENLKKELSKTN